ncbi:MAG TPA: carboxypeptidase regulatory-like domain-containing protein [Myxococcaceae bacterium]
MTQSAAVLPEPVQEPAPGSVPVKGGLTLQGKVLGPSGPAVGARVLATLAVEGETLSTLPCETLQRRTLLECAWDHMGLRVAELMEERRGEAPMRAEAFTAEDGSFTLPGLEPGEYALWVEGTEGTGFQNGVAAGASAVVLRMAKGVRLSGTITDDTKAPVPGALVTAIFSAHSRFFETVTDARGRFELGPLPGGALVIVIKKEGLLPTVQPMVGHKAEVKRDFELARPRRLMGRVLLGKAPVAGVEVLATGNYNTELGTEITDAQGRFAFEELPPLDVTLTAQYEGKATGVRIDKKDRLEQELVLELKPAAVLEGRVRDEHGQPVEGAELMLFLHEDDPEDGLMGPSWGKTAEAGSYRIGPIVPGHYTFKLSHPRFLTLEEEELILTAGETRRDFILTRAFLAEGVLVDSDGKPIPGEFLGLSPADPEDHDGPHSELNHPTDEEGRFVLAVPEPGDYLLKGRGTRLNKLEVPVRVPSSQLRIVAGTLLTVEGEVVDDAGGPLPHVMVSLWNESDHAKTSRRGFSETDAMGRFTLDVPAPGRYEVAAVIAWKEVVRVASRPVLVEGKDTPLLRLQLPAGRSLSGVVVDWHGMPVPGVLLQVLPSPRYTERARCCNPEIHLSTDAEGRFVFSEASGEYVEVCIKKGEHALVGSTPAQPRCARVKNDGQEVRLILGREVFVTGRLVRADGSPVTHFFVNGQEKKRNDGEFSIRVLQPGVESIHLSAPGGYSVQRISPVFAEGEVIQDLGSILLSP